MDESSVDGPSERQKQREKSKLNFAKGAQRDSILGKGTARRSIAERRRSTVNRSSTSSPPTNLMEVASSDLASADTPDADVAGESAFATSVPSLNTPPSTMARVPSAPPAPAELPNTVAELVRRLQVNDASPAQLESSIRALCQALSEQRAELKQQVLRNYSLKSDTEALDSKIRLLVQKRATLEDVMSMRVVADPHGEDSEGRLVLQDSRKRLYGNLFHYLQTRPKYLVRLIAQAHRPEQMDLLKRVVVFNMFGDQFETREERLLLSVIAGSLRGEFAASNGEIGSFMRSATAVTKLLQAYASRFTMHLSDLLLPLLHEMLSQRDLELELRPYAVYSAMINKYESETGQKWPGGPIGAQDDAQLASKEEVAAKLQERVPLLLAWCERFLARLEERADSFPFGIRWVSKQLDTLARSTFDGATEAQIKSIVGGFVYLRYINPAIVTPDGMNLLPRGQAKPMPVQRRNLVLVAKVLQNLSNGQHFGDKESFMVGCNDFIEGNAARMATFFDRLIAVDNDLVESNAEADLFLEHVQTREQTLTLTMHEVMSMHALVEAHADAVCDHSDSAEAVSEGEAGPEGQVYANTSATTRQSRSQTHMEDPLRCVLRALGPSDAVTVPRARSAEDGPCVLPLDGYNFMQATGEQIAQLPATIADANVVQSDRTGAEDEEVPLKNSNANLIANQERETPLGQRQSLNSGTQGPRRSASTPRRKVSVWDRLEAQQQAQLATERASAMGITNVAPPVTSGHIRVRSMGYGSTGDGFSADEDDRALKGALAAVLYAIPLEQALAKTVGAGTQAKDEASVTLMQLLAATYRLAEETGDDVQRSAVVAVAEQLEQKRRSETICSAAEPDVVVLAEDEACTVQGGHRRGGSDVFLFVEAPTQHTTLLNELAVSVHQMSKARQTLQTRLEHLRRAAAGVESHRIYLNQQLDLYRRYLDEVKKSVSQGGRKKSRLLKISLFTRSKSDEMKQSYKQLRDAGVIISSDIAARAQKAISFRFTQPQPGLFRISASAAGVASFTKDLFLEELLELQQRNSTRYDIREDVATLQLNVNMLVHLLDTVPLAAGSDAGRESTQV